MYTQIPDCRLCYGGTLIDVLEVGMQALTGIFPKDASDQVPSGPLTLVKCMDCGLVQLKHNYDLSMLYGRTYGYRSGLNQSMVRHLQSKVRQAESEVSLSAGDLVIDIGSNDGTLLGAYRDEGLRRIGMDPSGEKLRQYYKPGIELIPDFFTARAITETAGGRRAKVVTSIAMFYDLERPIDFAREVSAVLEDDGVWVFEQSYLPLMVATNSYDTICHEHLEYYCVGQIRYICEQADLKIVDVATNDVNGGSFSVTAAKRNSRREEATAPVERLIEAERAAGYHTTEPLEALRTTMNRHRTELVDLLTSLKQEGKKVLGYGASTKGNVLLQFCGITTSLLPAIAEVNEDKFGAWTPGTQIPIISEADAREQNPDFFLVLPWHFRQNILQREKTFLSSGRGFIFPLPELEVVTRPVKAFTTV